MPPRIIVWIATGMLGVISLSWWTSACDRPEQMTSTVSRPTAESTRWIRDKMVREQLERRGIRDARVLSAMRKVPRDRFVPEDYRSQAYEDGALPIGHGQTISQPYIVGLMTEVLELKGTERVLEIGTGSGYQAAVLAEIVPEVYSIELIEALSLRAKKTLTELGYNGIHLKVGNGYEGWPEHAPFDAIIVTAAPPEIPDALVKQLKIGGRLVVPVGTIHQDLILVRRTADGITQRELIPVRFVPMVDDRLF